MNQTSSLHFLFRGRRTCLCCSLFAVLFCLLFSQGHAAEHDVTAIVRETLPVAGRNSAYVGNREPLLPSPLSKLPIGCITPRGWLRHQLKLEAAGMIGRLSEISPWCNFQTNAWASPSGEGHSGWEELPYWLKGYGDLGYVLKDQAITAEARRWIDAVLSSQEESGWFGPRSLKKSLQGKPDLWPHMVMLNVLQSFHEYTADARVLPFLLRYHRWLDGQPRETFGNGYWPRIRFGDNLETVHWLYNRTGEAWLLSLGKKIHENMQDWTTGVHNWHNVNIAQGFREPAIYYYQSGDPRFLFAAERNYQQVMSAYGQFPGGGFGGDENCRPGYTDPRQGFETCGIVEFMHSFEILTRLTGNPLWADRCEEIAFNSFPASLTPDQKALHYLTCANQVQLDKGNKAPAIQNGGTMFSYSPFAVYRCCQHNVSHGWPYYAEELWHATLDNGLCASLYAASEVSATVGSDQNVTITEQTDYPFADDVTFKISVQTPTKFPLYLRIPRWCDRANVSVNGRRPGLRPKALAYVALERQWRDGDTIVLTLPMEVRTRTWPANHNAVSVDYGPLTLSLKIKETWRKYGNNPNWPEWEVFPASSWNYGLVLSGHAPGKAMRLSRRHGPLPENPFTPDTAPVEIEATARKIPAWKQDRQGMIGKLQPSPVRSEEPEETVTLIPMGAARLRVSSFPVVGQGADAHEWNEAADSPVTASHCFEYDSVEAITDGKVPANSSAQNLPRFTWWDHRGTAEWLEWKFPKSRRVSGVEIYWFDDRPTGQCRVPASWKLLYCQDETWKPVTGAAEFGTARDQFNRVNFECVQTTGLRVEVQLAPGVSGGVLEWRLID